MRVLQIVSSLDVGGLQVLLLTLARYLDRGLFECQICCISKEGHLADEFRELNVPVWVLGKHRKGFDWATFQKLYRLVISQNIDLIHTHDFVAHLYGRLIGLLIRRPVISSEHGDCYVLPGFHRWLETLTSWIPERKLCVSKDVSDTISSSWWPQPNIQVLYNCIGPDRLQSYSLAHKEALRNRFDIPLDHIVVGSVGRLSLEKGYDFLIRVAERVVKEALRTTFVIAGDGDLRNELLREVACRKLTTHVRFLGWVEPVADIYWLSDIYLCSSKFESLGIAILEAMYVGTPPIAPRLGGIPEVVIDGEVGLLYTPLSEESAAEKIIQLAADSVFRERLAMNGQERVRTHFMPLAYIDKLDTIYQTVHMDYYGRKSAKFPPAKPEA